MLKTLVKKQLYEIFSSYFINRKTGARRTGKKLVGYLAAMVALFGFLLVVFGGMAFLLSALLMPGKPVASDWLYFAFMGITALLLGIFGSVFNTYAGLYKAKDNDLLLSMPIPPGKILFSRMVTVLAMSLLYAGLVWIPALVVYWIIKDITLIAIVCGLVATVGLITLVSVLTCILGWVVALISKRLKSRKIVSVFVFLVFFGAYYYVCFRMQEVIQAILLNAVAIGEAIKGWLYPVYHMARAATGNALSLLVFLGISFVAFAICYYVLSRSFIKLVTATEKQEEKKYDAEKEAAKTKAVSVSKALYQKEVKRFLGSVTYMLNTGLGLVVMPIIAVIAIVKMDLIREYAGLFVEYMPWAQQVIPVLAICGVCMIGSLNPISAPSISLEGKNLWILQSMPVSGRDVLAAKEKLHFNLNIVPAGISILAFCFVLQLDYYLWILALGMTIVFVRLSGELGLMLNLKMPNLTWTNETVPIKQSAPVAIILFGGWIVSILMGGLAFLLRNHITAEVYLAIWLVAGAIIMRFTNHWLKTKGAAIFEKL